MILSVLYIFGSIREYVQTDGRSRPTSRPAFAKAAQYEQDFKSFPDQRNAVRKAFRWRADDGLFHIIYV